MMGRDATYRSHRNGVLPHHRRDFEMTNGKFYLLNEAPDGSRDVLTYTAAEMAEIFTAEQRALLAAGERVFHRWSKIDFNHLIIDMMVAANEKMDR
jgi:hypothetical protein